jgi:hypothetical protein
MAEDASPVAAQSAASAIVLIMDLEQTFIAATLLSAGGIFVVVRHRKRDTVLTCFSGHTL